MQVKSLGRFAPSPNGPLHLGSLVTAVGSYLHAKSRGGTWRVRVEDIDTPRVVPGAAGMQLDALARFGMQADGPVEWQSRFDQRHRKALESLLQARQAFYCACSRRELPASGIYPGTCRDGIDKGRDSRSVRVRVPAREVAFKDLVQGVFSQHLERDVGDFVIRRTDGLIAYQLAVVVDDAAAGVTEVVRGADLLDSTPRQIFLQQLLGLPTPAYMHLPLVVDPQGRKLSKSEKDDPVNTQRPREALRLALRLLGHEPPAGSRTLDAQWQWAMENWEPDVIPKGPCPL